MLRRIVYSSTIIPIVLLTILGLAVFTGRRAAVDEHGRPIVVYAHPPCPPELMAFYNPLFDEFKRTHPDIDFRVLHITGNYEDKIKVMFAGNVAPDVIFMYPRWLASWVELDSLEPLDDLLHESDVVGRDDYFPAMIEAFSYKGKIYGLPKDASCTIMEYNVDMFERYGVERPRRDWTWDDLLKAAKALTKDTNGDGRVDQWGMQAAPWWLYVWQNGGEILDAGGTRCLLEETEAVEALEFWAALRHKHGVTPTPEAASDLGTSRMFALERLGMTFEMYPVVAKLRKQCEFRWDVAHLPRGPRGAATDAVGSALAVVSQCRNKKAALEWVRWMTSPNGMRGVITFEFPSCTALALSDEWPRSAEIPKSKQVAVEAMDYVRPPMQHPRYQEIMDALGPELDKAQRGVIPVREALRAAVPQVNRILAREKAKGK